MPVARIMAVALAGIFLAMGAVVSAQGQAQQGNAPGSSNTFLPAGYSVASRGPSWRVWRQPVAVTNDAGSVQWQTNEVTELADGLCYLLNGVWTDSVPEISLSTDGAQSSGAQQSVHFAADVASPDGTVAITCYNGAAYRVGVAGLSLWDPESGSNVMIAEVQHAQGVLYGSNEVVYGRAFSGNILADVSYDLSRSSLEQNILLRSQFSPADYGLGTNSFLQCWTEFLDKPSPSVTTRTVGQFQDDAFIWFDGMYLNVGQALLVTNASGETISGGEVQKKWVVDTNGATYLVEQIPWTQASALLAQLPQHASAEKPLKRVSMLAALEGRKAPVGRGSRRASDGGARFLAMETSSKPYAGWPAAVLDYTTFPTETLSNYTMGGNGTFYLTGTLTVAGPSNVCQGGLVLKFATNASLVVASGAALQFQTDNYRPVTLTSSFDANVGQVVSSGLAFGPAANPALSVAGYVSGLTNVEFAYAKTALQYYGTNGPPLVISDCRFVNCSNGVYVSSNALALNNDLFGNVGDAILLTNSATNIAAAYVTVANGQLGPISAAGSYGFTNCLFAQMSFSGVGATLTGEGNGFYDCSSGFGSGYSTTTYPFQAVGGGSYYLTNGCAFLTGGLATLVTPSVLADIAGKTVVPPVVFTNATFSTVTNFSAAVARDTNGQALGYHYPNLDYVFGGCTANATLTFSNVAVGWFHTNSGGSHGQQGIHVADSGFVDFEGNAAAPCYWVRANTAQEGGNGGWSGGTGSGLTGWATNYADAPTVKMRWTRCASLGYSSSEGHICDDSGYILANLVDCEFYTGFVGWYSTSITATNCLFYRCGSGDYANDTNTSSYYRACTFYSTGIGSSNYVSVRDCALDNTPVNNWNSSGDFAYNGLLNGTSSPNPNGGHNQTNSVFAWVAGPLGNFYQSLSSGSNSLVNAGDQPASQLGLYHFTVETNLVNGVEVAETNGTVSMGYHYLASDPVGDPLDSVNRGLPDYIADANGDGIYDGGDPLDWTFPFYIFDQGQTYGGYTPKNLRLGYWKFDTNTWVSQGGQPPSANTGLYLSNSFAGKSVSLNDVGGVASELAYAVNYGGIETFNPSNGTLRFWFQPCWSNSSANAPTNGAAFLVAEGGGAGFQFGLDWGGSNYPTTFLATFETFNGAYAQPWSFQSNFFNGVPMSFRSNEWIQMTLTYTLTNAALYTNGVLLATANTPPAYSGNWLFEDGPGVIYYPNANELTDGFYFANHSGIVAALGQMDELETFNYPLSAKAVAYGFPYFGGAANVKQDTDYDSISDLLETNVYGTVWTNAASFPQCRLGYWRFNDPDLIGEQGQIPMSASGVSLANSWSGTALNIGTGASHLTYPDVSSNGWAAVNCRNGSIRFWYKPNASAINGTFFYMGSAESNDLWALNLIGGDEIQFVTQSNHLGKETVATSDYGPLPTGKWTQIVLTYSPSNSAIYVNGNQTVGSGNTNYPSLANRQLGLILGNNAALSSPINGQIDELETFNYQLAAADIASNFWAVTNVDSDLDGIPDLLEDIHLATNRPFLGRPVVITGTIEAEQFDMGSNGVAYSTSATATNTYRPSRLHISPVTDDLGGGYCLDQTIAGDWAKYSITVLVPQTYVVETRVASIGTGTGGVFQIDFTNGIGLLTNSAGYTNSTGPLTISNASWTSIAKVVYLPAGTNMTMTLHCLANSGSTNYVGRFNYISIYPWWAPPPQYAWGSPQSNYLGSLSSNNGVATWAAATTNAALIQAKLNAVANSGGGLIQIPPGTYYLAQTSPNETNPFYQNLAVYGYGTNVEIAGAGRDSTFLVGYNRATTLFSFGLDSGGYSLPYANVALRDLTIEARTQMAVSNVDGGYITGTEVAFDANPFYSNQTNDHDPALINGLDTGVPVAFSSYLPNQWPNNILITNCHFTLGENQVFLNDYLATNASGHTVSYTGLSNALIVANVFDMTRTNGPFDNCGVFGSGVNVVVVSNSFQGNTNLSPTTNIYVSTAIGQNRSGGGLVWIQSGGNVFVGRNIVTNYTVEAVQVNAGPNAVAGNSFYSLISDDRTCALCADGTTAYLGGDVTFNPINYSTTFVGNWGMADATVCTATRATTGLTC